MAVLDSRPFHVALWIMIIVGFLGNLLVIVWRCTRPPSQRGSVLSITIIILAVADLLYCVHLGMLEGLVARPVFGGANLSTSLGVMNFICRTSGNLSLLSCSTAMWMTLNIAVYSCQALIGCGCCCHCCLLVDRRGCLFVTVVCQLLFFILPIIEATISLNQLLGINVTLPSTADVNRVFSTCAYVESTGAMFGGVIFFNNISTDYESSEFVPVMFGTLTGFLNSLLSLSCAFIYLAVCIRLNRQFHMTDNVSQGVTELSKLKWRLSFIVLINTACWIPVTTIHIGFTITYFLRSLPPTEMFDLLATNVILISISPAINPLIYTISGKQFMKFLKRCWKFVKCHVTIGDPRETDNVDYPIGERRCTCFPCIQCIRPTGIDVWNTEEASLFSSSDENELECSLSFGTN
jgi:hypothetical protein